MLIWYEFAELDPDPDPDPDPEARNDDGWVRGELGSWGE